MFACRLCNKLLHSKSEILGTYCGHAFHQICLDLHLKKSTMCPTCKKSLKVNMALLATLSHDFAILPLHLEECRSRRTKNHDNSTTIAHENAILRQKLVELTQAIILQDEKKNSQSSSINYKEEIFRTMENAEIELSNYEKQTRKASKTWNLSEQYIPYKHGTDENENHLSKSAKNVAQWTDAVPSLSEREKERILRSKRREYLTWRNKAQTWLSKMEKASGKLLRAEACFTQQEFLTQLHLFYNKLSLQGEIVETARKASLIYLIIGDISETEKETIHVDMQHATSALKNITMKIFNKLDKINTLSNHLGSSLANQSDGKNNGKTWIRGEVSQCPKSTSNDFLLSHFSLTDNVDVEMSFREPIFV